MTKRYGGLFAATFSEEGLYQAFLSARRDKRKTRACLHFSARLGREIADLQRELFAGEYRPRPYRELWVAVPKPRQILAPHFRDVVVQHAMYRTLYPIFNRTFIHTSFACRVGKGTHAASDYVYRALQEADPDAYTLHLDVRRYFQSVDQAVLQRLLAARIKDQRMLAVMYQFCSSGGGQGIPLGNLLSQLYALVYLSPVDHYAKRVLGLRRYARYVDDMIIVGLRTREAALGIKLAIEAYLAERLHLGLSKWSMRRVRDGVNFVGYRTWPTHRLIRKFSLQKFRRAVRRRKDDTAWSIIAHAQHTSSTKTMRAVALADPDFVRSLPESHQRRLGLCCQ